MVLGMGPRVRGASRVVPVRLIGRQPLAYLVYTTQAILPRSRECSDPENQRAIWPPPGSDVRIAQVEQGDVGAEPALSAMEKLSRVRGNQRHSGNRQANLHRHHRQSRERLWPELAAPKRLPGCMSTPSPQHFLLPLRLAFQSR